MVCQLRTSNDSIAIEKDSGISQHCAETQVAEQERLDLQRVGPWPASEKLRKTMKKQPVVARLNGCAKVTF
jgi:hypothetical protein